MRIKLNFLLLAISLVLLQSCAHQIMNFTVMSSNSINLKYKDGAKGTIRVEGKGSTLDKAVNNALKNAGNGYDALVDGKVTMYHYSFVLFWIANFKVEGTPIKTSEVRAMLGDKSFDEWCKQNNVLIERQN